MIFQSYTNVWFCTLRKLNTIVFILFCTSFFITETDRNKKNQLLVHWVFYQLYFHVFYMSYECVFLNYYVHLINASFYECILICWNIGWFFNFLWTHNSVFRQKQTRPYFNELLYIFIRWVFFFQLCFHLFRIFVRMRIFYLFCSFNKSNLLCTPTNLLKYWMIFQFYMNT